MTASSPFPFVFHSSLLTYVAATRLQFTQARQNKYSQQQSWETSKYNVVVKKTHHDFPFHDISRIYNKSNTTGATGETGTACPPGTLKFSPLLAEFVLLYLKVFCVLFCKLMFVILSFGEGGGGVGGSI
jgi:hypothetical protein